MFSISPEVFWPYLGAIVALLVAIVASWRPVSRSSGVDKLRALAPALYAMPLIIFGAEHFSSAKSIMTLIPKWMPGRLFWTYFVGAALLLAGFSISLNVRRRLSATLTGIMFFLFEVLMHIPNLTRSALGGQFTSTPGARIIFAVAGRDFVFGCGAFLIAVAIAQPSNRATLERWLARGIALLAILFGLIHFWYPRFAPGVPLAKPNPTWMPGGPVWGYATGAALVVGAIAMMRGDATRRKAALALGAALVFLVLVFYVPILLQHPGLEELNYVADTLLFASSILLAAGPSPKSA